MSMNFAGYAGQGSDFDLLPKGLLVFANLQVRGVQTSATPSRYLDVELTVDQGQPFAGRKLWDKIGDPFFQGNSEKYRQMGQVAITRILEAGRGAGPNNPAAYQLNDFSELSGLRVPIKVGVEEGSDGHDDKNRVTEWLTPNPASASGYKGFQKLTSGDHGLPQPNGAAPAASGFGNAPAASPPAGGQTTSGFGGAAAQPVTQQTSGFGAPNPGFPQPLPASSAQTGANGAGEQQPSTQPSTTTFPSDPGTPPNWLAQANGGAPQG